MAFSAICTGTAWLLQPSAAGLSADQELDRVSYMILEVTPKDLVIDHRRVPVNLQGVTADVAEEYRGGPADESWLVTRFRGESRIQTRDWQTRWGRVRVRRMEGGSYTRPRSLWDLTDRTPPPSCGGSSR